MSFRLEDGKHHEASPGSSRIIIKSCDIQEGLIGIGRQPDGEWFIYEDNIDADPRFVDADNGDYRLKANSSTVSMEAPLFGWLPVVTHTENRLTTWGELKIQ